MRIAEILANKHCRRRCRGEFWGERNGVLVGCFRPPTLFRSVCPRASHAFHCGRLYSLILSCYSFNIWCVHLSVQISHTGHLPVLPAKFCVWRLGDKNVSTSGRLVNAVKSEFAVLLCRSHLSLTIILAISLCLQRVAVFEFEGHPHQVSNFGQLNMLRCPGHCSFG